MSRLFCLIFIWFLPRGLCHFVPLWRLIIQADRLQWNAVDLLQILIKFLLPCLVMTHRVGCESLHNFNCKTHLRGSLIAVSLHFEELCSAAVQTVFRSTAPLVVEAVKAALAQYAWNIRPNEFKVLHFLSSLWKLFLSTVEGFFIIIKHHAFQ